MRRRSFFAGAVALGATSVVGCRLSPTPHLESPASLEGDAASYVLAFSNSGAGDDPSNRQGLALRVSADGASGDGVTFTPIDNARLLEHNGAAAWLSNEEAHYWGRRHETWTIPPGGAVDALVPAGARVLASINYGTQDSVSYDSALMLFNDTDHQYSEHDGFLGAGIGWNGELAFGFSAAGLSPDAQLTLLPPATEAGFGPVTQVSQIWGERIATLGQYSFALVSRTPGPESVVDIWRIDPAEGSVTPLPLTGPGADVAQWYSGNGPAMLTGVDNSLYWLASGSLWVVDPESGASEEVVKLSRDSSWFLGVSGVVGVSRAGERWSLVRRSVIDGRIVQEIEGISVPSVPGLHPFGAVHISP